MRASSVPERGRDAGRLAVVEVLPRAAQGLSSPIVFLHGAASAGISWRPQLVAFGDERHCIAVDLPAHGRSGGVRWTSLDAAADAVAREIELRAKGPAHIVGFSLGGCVGIRLLARHPERIASALLSGSVTAPAARIELALDTLTWPFVSNPIAHRLIARTMRVSAAERAEYLATSSHVPIADFGRLSRQVLRGADTSGIGGAGVPVLALAGARESRQARVSLREIAARVPGGVAAEVPRARHSWPVSQPERMNGVLREWLAQPGQVPTGLLLKAAAVL